MSKYQTSAMLKGLGIGMAVGTAAAVAGTKMCSKGSCKGMKKGASRCMKNIGDMLDNVQSMMK